MSCARSNSLACFNAATYSPLSVTALLPEGVTVFEYVPTSADAVRKTFVDLPKDKERRHGQYTSELIGLSRVSFLHNSGSFCRFDSWLRRLC
jgi:hypothetical protein